LYQLLVPAPTFSPADVAFFRDLPSRVKIAARVGEEPDLRPDRQNLVVDAEKIFLTTPRTVQGKVMVKADRYPEFAYGDELEISCRLETPPVFDGFSYASLLAEDNIYALCVSPSIKRVNDLSAQTGFKAGNWMDIPGQPWEGFWRAVFGLKQAMAEKIDSLFVQPQSGMVLGILFGERHAIPEDVLAEFNSAGLIHALTVTGYSFSIIIGLFAILAKNAARRWRYAWIFGGMMVLVALTGFSAKVLRAAWMASIMLLAQAVGRKGSGLHLLLITAVIMTSLSPRMILVDASFQFSFLSVLGIMVLVPKFEAFEQKAENDQRYARFFWIVKIPPFVREVFWVTLSAQLFTIPLLLLNSGNFSLVAPFANILVLPLIPPVMLLSFLAMVSSFAIWPIAQLLSFAAYVLLSAMIMIVHFFIGLPFATVHL
jgi:competence protein ComEC